MQRIQDFKGIVFDMDGVLRIGREPIKGAETLFSKFKDRALIVTNECRRTPEVIKQELKDMGIEIYNTPILTAGVMTYNYLYEMISSDKNKEKIFNVMTIGEEGLLDVIEELSFLNNYRKITPIFLKKAQNQNRNFSDNSKYTNYLVLGTINNISTQLISTINSYFNVFTNVKVLITCPDKLDSEGSNVILPKYLVHILNYNRPEPIVPYHIGKPNPIITKYIEKYFYTSDNNEIDGEIVFVGDTLSTDIKLANEAFFKSILVLSGNTEYNDLKKSQIQPDYVINSVADIENVISINY
jgi:HAD superfamily hydrolase (TIGR01450 family)